MNIRGQCHCGKLKFSIQTSIGESSIRLRACNCGFCRAHGAKAWSDPDGQTEIFVRNAAELQAYKFALETAEFLICKNCGVYLAAVLKEGSKLWSTVNMRLTSLRGLPAASVDYGSESAAERIKRRKHAWTPTTISFAA